MKKISVEYRLWLLTHCLEIAFLCISISLFVLFLRIDAALAESEKYESLLVLLENEAGRIKGEILRLENEIELLKAEIELNRKKIQSLNKEIHNIIRILYFIELEKKLNHFLLKDIETKNIRYGEYIRSIIMKYNENLKDLKYLSTEYAVKMELLNTKLEKSLGYKKELDKKIENIYSVMSEKEKYYKKTAADRKKLILTQREESSKKIEEVAKFNIPEEKEMPNNEQSNPFRIMWPVRQGDVIREFGGYYDEAMNLEKFSRGIIIKAPFLSEVFCVADGKVLFSGWLKGVGNTIIAEHSQGFISVYSHLARVEVSKGENIREGDVIGFVGDTGSNEGVMLYFELRKNGKAIDPMNYIR